MFRIERTRVNLREGESLPIPAETDGTAGSAPGGEADGSSAASDEALAAKDAREAEEAERLERVAKAAEELINQAHTEAEQRIQAAELQAAEIKAQGWREGYEDGKRAAEEEAAGQAQKDEQTLREAIAELARAQEDMAARYEDDILELCLAMVKKVVNAALMEDETVMEAMLKKALRQMKWEGGVTIRVSGEVQRRFFSSGSATFVIGDRTITATVQADPSMKEGDCVLEAAGESVNAGVDSQMRYIELAFRRAEEE